MQGEVRMNLNIKKNFLKLMESQVIEIESANAKEENLKNENKKT